MARVRVGICALAFAATASACGGSNSAIEMYQARAIVHEPSTPTAASIVAASIVARAASAGDGCGVSSVMPFEHADSATMTIR